MDRSLAFVLSAVVGGLIAMQAPINATLGRSIGNAQAALVNFLVGAPFLLGLVLVWGGGLGPIARDLRGDPVLWHYIAPGLLGAMYVSTVIFTVRSIGAAGILVAMVAGQILLSMTIDHYGAFGVPRDPATPLKAVGLIMVAVGAYLAMRR